MTFLMLEDNSGAYELEDGSGGIKLEVSASYAATVLADSPVAYWRLGEPSGTDCLDSSTGGGADGYYENGPTLGVAGLLTGDADTCVTFAGASSQYVVVYTAVPIGTSAGLAMEAWVKPSTMSATTPYPVCKWYLAPQDCRLDYYENGASSYWRYFFYDGTTVQEVDSATHDMTTGSTYHVVVSHNFSTELVTFYVNGSILGSAIDVSGFGPASLVGAAANATIARGGSEYWNGTLDEVAFYGSTLSSTRVAAHYAAGSGT